MGTQGYTKGLRVHYHKVLFIMVMTLISNICLDDGGWLWHYPDTNHIVLENGEDQNVATAGALGCDITAKICLKQVRHLLAMCARKCEKKYNFVEGSLFLSERLISQCFGFFSFFEWSRGSEKSVRAKEFKNFFNPATS